MSFLQRVIVCSMLFGSTICIAQHQLTDLDGQPPLKANASVDDVKACQNNPGLFTVYIQLHISASNTSKRPIILARQLPPVRVLVATSEAAGRRGDYIYSPSSYAIQLRPQSEPRFGKAPGTEMFAILSPGEKLTTEVWTGVLADLSRQQTSPGALKDFVAGTYMTQVVLSTWPYPTLSPRQLLRLQSRWSQYGNLVTQHITTDYFPVTLPLKQTAPSCDSFKSPTEKPAG